MTHTTKGRPRKGATLAFTAKSHFVRLEPELQKQVELYADRHCSRDKNGVPNKSEAIRCLLWLALNCVK